MMPWKNCQERGVTGFGLDSAKTGRQRRWGATVTLRRLLHHLNAADARKIVLRHVVALAISPRGVLFLATGDLAPPAAVNALPLRSQATVPPHLLVVPKAEPLGDLWFLAAVDTAVLSPLLVLSLGRQPAMPANLLIMLGTVATSARIVPAAVSLTHCLTGLVHRRTRELKKKSLYRFKWKVPE